ncbi:FG-GAP-like repeat-containing protein [Streptomyces sp. KR55]|uniref:FG-GAP-like repeat-containing protein n=1 Tax=Streptomyces sp. KR55 TaxID=3457425 RepID=UPI003FD59F59
MITPTHTRLSLTAAVAVVAGCSLALLAPWQAAAAVTPPRADFNNDGRVDLALGVPAYADGTVTGAGAVSVLPGAAAGPNASAKLVVTQNSTLNGTALPGSSEADDAFGSATAYGDINGDGYGDLAIGASGEDDTAGHNDIGGITLLYGSASGFTADPTMYHLPTALRHNGQRCGTSLAVGDFNADGKGDVLSLCSGSSSVMWIDGATKAVRTNAGTVNPYAPIEGEDITTADVDGDGYDEAVLSVVNHDVGPRMTVLPGSATGLKPESAAQVDRAPAAWSLATGDVNGDGRDDVIGGSPYGGSGQGGAVVALYGSTTGLSADRSTTITQDTTGVPGSDEASDQMGYEVAVADVDSDDVDDVVAGVPGEDLGETDPYDADQGAVLVLRGRADGLTGEAATTYSAATEGVAGAAEAGDLFGSAVAAADFTGDGNTDLAVGIPGENTGDGTVLTLNNNTAGGMDTGSGLYFGPGALNAGAGSEFGIGRVLAP